VAYVEPYGTRKPPVSNHPLFPAVVALWFAALFGLGSFVLPNILFERIIVLTGIGELIPAAAPPLGVTARLIVSATMALIGAWLGFSVARKIAQAQVSARPLRGGRRQQRNDYFDEPRARRPISARDELGATRLESPPPADPGMGSRRRALAMQEDDRPSDYLRQHAPLPGTQHDYAAPPPAVEPEPLDLAHFAAPPQPQHQPEAGYGDQIAALRNAAPSGQDRPETVAPAVEWTQPPAPDFNQPDFSRPAAPEFSPPPPVAHHFTAPATSPVAQAAQQFARPAPAPAPQFAPPPMPMQDFSRPAPEPLPFARPAPPATMPAPMPAGHDPLAPVRAPDVAPEPEDDDEDEYFPFGAAAFRPAPSPVPEPQPVSQPEAPAVAAPAPAEPQTADAPLAFFAPSQAAEAEELPGETPAAPEPVATAAPAPREPLDGLSMVDLAERLARSLGRHGGAIAAPAGLAAALGAQIAPSPTQPAPAEPQPLPEPELEDQADDLDAFAELTDDDPADASELPAEFARTFDAPPPPVIPEALRPIPLELEEFGEDEDDLDLSLSFGRQLPADNAPPPGAQVFLADPLDEQDELDGTGEEDDDLSEIAGYSSLLAMKSPFRGSAEFVRIEQPEPADAPAEPAVVFPGQQPATSVLAEAPAEPQLRRFDAPGKVSALEAPAANRPKVDRDEAERSLRSALATLQRMSGAA
jgi:hypothetical protein